MLEVLPSNRLPAESLQFNRLNRRKTCTGEMLTLRILSKSLVRYRLGTFTATRLPSYVHRDTVAWPP